VLFCGGPVGLVLLFVVLFFVVVVVVELGVRFGGNCLAFWCGPVRRLVC